MELYSIEDECNGKSNFLLHVCFVTCIIKEKTIITNTLIWIMKEFHNFVCKPDGLVRRPASLIANYWSGILL